MIERRFLPLAVAACAAISVLAVPAVAFAQDATDQNERVRGERPRGIGGIRSAGETGPGGPRGQWRQAGEFRRQGAFGHLLLPDFHVRDMAIIAQQLDLDQSQRPIVEALLTDYRQAFTEAAADLEDASRRVRRPRFSGTGGFGFTGDSHVFPLPNGEGTVQVQFDRGGEDAAELQVQLPEGEGVVEVHAEEITIDIGVRPQTSTAGDNVNVTSTMVLMGPDGMVIEGDLSPEMQERLDQVMQRMQQRRERMEERRRQWREREEQREASGELLDPSEVVTIAREFLDRKEQLRERLIQDVDLMLTPLQQEQWPKVQQALRRLNTAAVRGLSGERVDLTRVLQDLHLSSIVMAALEDLINRYTDELDEAIRHRNSFLDAADIDRFEATHAEDWDRLLDIADRESELRVAVRSVNQAFTTRMAEVLPEGKRNTFEAEVMARSFPQLAQPTHADRMLRRALELESLDPERRELVAALKADFDRQSLAMIESHRQTILQDEVHRPRRMLEMMMAMRSGEAEAIRPPMMELVANARERARLSQNFLNQLRAVIPQEEMPELHERERRERRAEIGEMFRTRQVIREGDGVRTRQIIIDTDEE